MGAALYGATEGKVSGADKQTTPAWSVSSWARLGGLFLECAGSWRVWRTTRRQGSPTRGVAPAPGTARGAAAFPRLKNRPSTDRRRRDWGFPTWPASWTASAWRARLGLPAASGFRSPVPSDARGPVSPGRCADCRCWSCASAWSREARRWVWEALNPPPPTRLHWSVALPVALTALGMGLKFERNPRKSWTTPRFPHRERGTS